MSTRKTKFSISVKELEIQFEGSQEVGQQFQQGVQQVLGGLINAQGRMMALREQVSPGGEVQVVEAPAPAGAQTGANGHAVASADGDKTKRQRRTKGGPSIGNLLFGLKQEGFFSQARSSGEVLSHLKDSKGHSLRGPAVMTELQRMVQKQDGDPAKLYRSKNDSENYIYKDSPFDESSGSPNAGEQSA